MNNENENVSITPKYGFWQVTVQQQIEDPETGKIKKVKEVHLVDGANCTEVEAKVKEEMEGTMYEWKIISCAESKIGVVY